MLRTGQEELSTSRKEEKLNNCILKTSSFQLIIRAV